jgi:signal peptidase
MNGPMGDDRSAGGKQSRASWNPSRKDRRKAARETSRADGEKKRRRRDSPEGAGKSGGKKRLVQEALPVIRDILVAVGIMVIVLGSLYAYCGVWPPMVVVESNSMMHGSDSQIGVIDTGDLTLVKAIDDRGDVITYIEAHNPKDPNHGFQTYGDFGNVIVYRKNGLADTPVIHRAMAWIEYNATASVQAKSYRGDIPDIGVYNVSSYTLPYGVGFRNIALTIDLAGIFNATGISRAPHDGFVTLGDNNRGSIDQLNLKDQGDHWVEPVRTEWVVGVAQGELPWFGLFKLWISGQDTGTFPPASSAGLILTIVLVVTVPLAADYLIARWRKKRGDRQEISKESRKGKGG